MNDHLHYQSQLLMRMENAQRRRLQDAYPGRPEGPLEGPFDLDDYDRLAEGRQNRPGEYDPFGHRRRKHAEALQQRKDAASWRELHEGHFVVDEPTGPHKTSIVAVIKGPDGNWYKVEMPPLVPPPHIDPPPQRDIHDYMDRMRFIYGVMAGA